MGAGDQSPHPKQIEAWDASIRRDQREAKSYRWVFEFSLTIIAIAVSSFFSTSNTSRQISASADTLAKQLAETKQELEASGQTSRYASVSLETENGPTGDGRHTINGRLMIHNDSRREVSELVETWSLDYPPPPGSKTPRPGTLWNEFGGADDPNGLKTSFGIIWPGEKIVHAQLVTTDADPGFAVLHVEVVFKFRPDGRECVIDPSQFGAKAPVTPEQLKSLNEKRQPVKVCLLKKDSKTECETDSSARACVIWEDRRLVQFEKAKKAQ